MIQASIQVDTKNPELQLWVFYFPQGDALRLQSESEADCCL